MSEIEIKGNTVEEAIAKGLKQLGCTRENAEIKVLEEGSTGLFGLMGSKPAVVLITVDESVCKTVISADDAKELKKKTEKTLSDILRKMGAELKSVSAAAAGDIISAEIKVTDSDGNFIIGKNGQTLDALEYITQLIVNHNSDTKIKVNLDCLNYRAKQHDKLKILADKGVDYVLRTQKIFRFDPMGAKERKFIHSYLENNPKVESFSEGDGRLRKVGIKAKVKSEKWKAE